MASVDFPAPELPTNATKLPGSISSDTPRTANGRIGVYRKLTSCSVMRPLSGGAAVTSFFFCSGSASSTSSIRSM